MTAVVGILNKKGVAIAADSAVTVSNTSNRKVYNSANKIFTLSKYHPVGIALYSGADFMGIPWEIIIKEYRKYIEQKSFDTIAGYRDDFLRWMIKDQKLFAKDRNDDFIMNDFYVLLKQMVQEIEKNELPLNKQNLITIFQNFQSNLETFEFILNDDPRIMEHLNEFKVLIIQSVRQALEINLVDIDVDFLLKVYYSYLLRNYFLNYTGLIFVGYGDKELFPRVLPVNVSIALVDQLRFSYDTPNEVIINNKYDANVIPFAQKDVIQTILQGISPDILVATQDIFSSFFESLLKLANGLPNLSSEIKEIAGRINREQIDAFSKPFIDGLYHKIQGNHITPMLNTVSHLDKEDLAEMAESLIYLTYLKRRFTMVEESVGGPVDVAIITKGDGFVWIKRKHYFEPKLNEHFFQKYYK